MVVLVAAILLWMAVLQLFGRAPVAAFNGDAAQKGKKKEGRARGEFGLSPRHRTVCFSKDLILLFYSAFTCMNQLRCNFLKASYCSGQNNSNTITICHANSLIAYRSCKCSGLLRSVSQQSRYCKDFCGGKKKYIFKWHCFNPKVKSLRVYSSHSEVRGLNTEL